MKRTRLLLLGILCVSLFLVVGCTKKEEEPKLKYKMGVYNAEVVDDYNNEGNIASAKVTIDGDGVITSVYLDTTYKTSEGVQTTKKQLRDDYNMKKYMPDAQGEWYEEVEKLEQAIVNNQGVDFLTLKDDNTTDTVAGCTIKINALKEATVKALEQALKD